MKIKKREGTSRRKQLRGLWRNPKGMKRSDERQALGSADLKYQRKGITPQAELLPSIALKTKTWPSGQINSPQNHESNGTVATFQGLSQSQDKLRLLVWIQPDLMK